METTNGSDTMNVSDVLEIIILIGFIDIIILLNYVIFGIITGGIK